MDISTGVGSTETVGASCCIEETGCSCRGCCISSETLKLLKIFQKCIQRAIPKDSSTIMFRKIALDQPMGGPQVSTGVS